MRNAETVYLVGMAEFGAHQGSTTMTMRLLRGNELLEVDDVLYVEQDGESLEFAWEDNLDLLAQVGEGVRLLEVTAAEADALYAARLDGDEDDVEVVQEATATGWRLTVEGEEAAEVVGDLEAGTWRTQHASGTYESFVDHDDQHRMRFLMEDGTVADVVRADQDCFKRAWLWGLG